MVNIVSNKHNLLKFRNEEALENILNILSNSDDSEIKKRALSLLIELMSDPDVIDILLGLN